MRGHVARLLADGADQRQSRDPLRAPVGDGPREVRAEGVADDRERLVTGKSVDQAEHDIEGVVGATEPVRQRGAPHSRQVRINAPIAGPVTEHGFQSSGNLPMVHARAVQRQNGHSAAVLDDVHRDIVELRIHHHTLASPPEPPREK